MTETMTAAQRNWQLVQQIAQEQRERSRHQPSHTNGKHPPRADLSKRLTKYMEKIEPGIQGEHGSNPTWKAACCLVQGFALSQDEALPYMVEYSNRCLPPWSDKEIRHKLKQADERQDYKGRPRGYLLNSPLPATPRADDEEEPVSYCPDPAPEQFPYHAFPDAVKEYCLMVERAKKAPSVYVGGAVLAATATALGASRVLQVKNDWQIYGNLWVALVGLSGDGKSPVLHEVMQPLVDIDLALEEENRKAEDEYAREISQWERNRKQGIHSPRPKPKPPQGILIDNITVESTIQMLACNPRGLTNYRDEMTGWFESMAQYKPGGKGDDRAVYMSLFSNQRVKYNRKNLGLVSLDCTSPYLSVIGGMQPSVLHVLRSNENKEQDREDGLRERLCYAFPSYRPLGESSRSGVPGDYRRWWKDVVNFLWSLSMVQDAQGARKPQPVAMTEEATGMYFDWIDRTRLEADQMYDQGDTLLRGIYLKINALGGKLALLTHFLREACSDVDRGSEIDNIDIAAGCRLADHYKTHAKKAMDVQRMSTEEHKAQEMYHWVQRQGGEVLLSMAAEKRPCGLRTKTALLECFRQMEDLGMGKTEQVTRNGSRKGTKFVCSNTSQDSDKS